jgi:hypothetical protein
MKTIIKNILAIACLSLAIVSCQDLDRPELGDYPIDENAPGGSLKFYVNFDRISTNPLMTAVDEIRANFPQNNNTTTTTGISGNAMQGAKYKYIKYAKANDFAATASSFSVAFWQKKGEFQTEHIFSLPAVGYHWSGASMFLLMEGSVTEPIAKLFVKDAVGENWFEWVPWNAAGAVTGIYDGNWHHMAFVYDATTSKMTLFVDGVPRTSNTWGTHGAISLEPTKINSLKLGAGPQEFSNDEINSGASDWLKNSWTGGLDNFRLYSSALTATEVQELYTNLK